jgi:hypothetical protein
MFVMDEIEVQKTRLDNLKIFHNLIQTQFTYGAKKYGINGNSTRESTDILFDVYGHNWVYGTMHKYTNRSENTFREKDPLKIATYAYLLFLKRGFNLVLEGTKSVNDTTIKIKESYFEHFQNFIAKCLYSNEDRYIKDLDTQGYILNLKTILVGLSKLKFNELTASNIFEIYYYSFRIWELNFINKIGEDTDCNNESKYDEEKK